MFECSMKLHYQNIVFACANRLCHIFFVIVFVCFCLWAWKIGVYY